MTRIAKKNGNGLVISALHVRTSFGSVLRQIEDENRSVVIEKRGTPRAVMLSIRDYVRLAAPEPEVLTLIGEESRRNGTDRLTTRQINEIIQSMRAHKRKRR